ncbi:hypothetical protein MASR1M32_23340 [Rhodobacter sp.]
MNWAACPRSAFAASAGDLSGAYILVERARPRLVILGQELTRHPDFSGLLAMFRVMEIAWLQIGSGDGADGTPFLDPSLSGPAMLPALHASLARPAETLPPPAGAGADRQGTA